MQQVFFHIVNIILPILICILVGFALGKFKQPFDTRVIASLMANIGYPALILSHLVGKTVELDIFFKMLGAALAVVLGGALITSLFLKATHLSNRTYLSALSLSNVGNIGLPICALVYGPQGLIYGLAFVVVVMLFNFTIGQWVSSGQFSIKSLVTNPLIYSVILSILMLLTRTHFPKPLHESLSILGNLAIPLMLLTLGYSLASMRLGNLVLGSGLALYHLLIALVLAWGLLPLFDFTGVARGVFILECLMPVAASTYLWVSIYRPDDSSNVASVILVSTLLTILVIPLALTYWV
ncbi:AEC family transporter [Dongshaea marina]|uniref:AEC family transporter n=1 Tax=Dongshaea marina TaxID=2047966 RepID=UPI00131F4429|nr:AEC family transporter [Dongshaea marina]